METLPDKITKTGKNRRLSGILLFHFLAFFMLIFIILAAASGYIILQNEQRIVFLQHQRIAHEAVDIVKDFFNEKFTALETTARLVNPALTTQKEQEQDLNYLLGEFPVFRRLILKDEKKQNLVVKSRLSYIGSEEFVHEEIENAIYNRTKQDKRYISELYVDRRSSEPIILIAVPVKDYFGDFQGILTAELNLKFMWDLMDSIKIGKTGVVYIVDRQGKLIAFHDVSRVLKGENMENLKVVHEFMINPGSINEDQVYRFTGITGTPVIGSYLSLGEPDFAVVTEQSVYEAYQSVIRISILSLVFSLIMWGLIFLISIRLARRLSIPLVNLMKTAVRIAGGERGLHVPVSGPVETSNMAEAFNSMTTQLNDVIDSLENHNKYLQSTVQRYVEYMAGVGNGQLDTFLTLDEKENETADPLIILGHQLNATTLNLNKKIGQIQETTEKLKINEEKLLIYSNQLEKSNKELEQFAYIASHDLQEPLRKLKFFSEKLKKNYGSMIDEDGTEMLERIVNAVIRMENLITGLLRYSRVTTRARPFKKTDLNEIVNGVLDDLEIRIHETDAEIKTGNLPVIEADPLQMRQLFQNLIGNSIKYKSDNAAPVIAITADIKNDGDNSICAIKIIDNGMGFDDKYKEQIFGLFKRLHGHNEREGTGIGLAICKKIVEQHKGVISASGKTGEGSTFYIELPLKQETIE